MEASNGADRLDELSLRVATQGAPPRFGPEDSALVRIAFSRFGLTDGEATMSAHIEEILPRWRGGDAAVAHTEERLERLTTEELTDDPRLQRALDRLRSQIDWQTPTPPADGMARVPALPQRDPIPALALRSATPWPRPPFAEMLAAFADCGTGRDAQKAASRLPAVLDADERLLAFVQTSSPGSLRKSVLVLTDRRLLVVGRSDPPILQVDLARVSGAELDSDLFRRLRLTVKMGVGTREFHQIQPPHQGERMSVLLGGPEPGEELLRLLADQPMDPLHPPLAVLEDLQLYSDRLIDENGRHLPLAAGEVRAQVDTAGNIAVTRGRDLGAKAVAGVATFGLGLFLVGNARENVTDSRELYLLVESRDWAHATAISPDLGVQARRFAGDIVTAARRLTPAEAESTEEGRPDTSRLADGLRQLASLRDDGLLTEDEFLEQKRRLLNA